MSTPSLLTFPVPMYTPMSRGSGLVHVSESGDKYLIIGSELHVVRSTGAPGPIYSGIDQLIGVAMLGEKLAIVHQTMSKDHQLVIQIKLGDQVKDFPTEIGRDIGCLWQKEDQIFLVDTVTMIDPYKYVIANGLKLPSQYKVMRVRLITKEGELVAAEKVGAPLPIFTGYFQSHPTLGLINYSKLDDVRIYRYSVVDDRFILLKYQKTPALFVGVASYTTLVTIPPPRSASYGEDTAYGLNLETRNSPTTQFRTKSMRKLASCPGLRLLNLVVAGEQAYVSTYHPPTRTLQVQTYSLE